MKRMFVITLALALLLAAAGLAEAPGVNQAVVEMDGKEFVFDLTDVGTRSTNKEATQEAMTLRFACTDTGEDYPYYSLYIVIPGKPEAGRLFTSADDTDPAYGYGWVRHLQGLNEDPEEGEFIVFDTKDIDGATYMLAFDEANGDGSVFTGHFTADWPKSEGYTQQLLGNQSITYPPTPALYMEGSFRVDLSVFEAGE